MQRVTNCILLSEDHVLMLKKPRHGWYAIPGGKMEPGETIKESVVREFLEETDLHLDNPELMGVFTFNVVNDDVQVREWMMFTFMSHSYHGILTDTCMEGELAWMPIKDVINLPMAEGDREIFHHVLTDRHILYGSFRYTEGDQLIDMRLDPTGR